MLSSDFSAVQAKRMQKLASVAGSHVADCKNLCQIASFNRGWNRGPPINVNDLLFLRLTPNHEIWMLNDSAAPK